MVAIGGESDMCINFETLYNGVKQKLPSYARPYFVRIVSETDMTGTLLIQLAKYIFMHISMQLKLLSTYFNRAILGTYKLKKRKLQKEGFNPRDINDPLYFVDHETSSYIPLTQELHDKIVSGLLKL